MQSKGTWQIAVGLILLAATVFVLPTPLFEVFSDSAGQGAAVMFAVELGLLLAGLGFVAVGLRKRSRKPADAAHVRHPGALLIRRGPAGQSPCGATFLRRGSSAGLRRPGCSRRPPPGRQPCQGPAAPVGRKASSAGSPWPHQSKSVRLLWELPVRASAGTPGSQPGSQMKYPGPVAVRDVAEYLVEGFKEVSPALAVSAGRLPRPAGRRGR